MALPADPATSLLNQSIGSRVSIRLKDPAGGYRDLLGVLIATDSVRRKDGTVANFDRSAVVAFRIVESPAP